MVEAQTLLYLIFVQVLINNVLFFPGRLFEESKLSLIKILEIKILSLKSK